MGNTAFRKMKNEPFAVKVMENNIGLGDTEKERDPGNRITGLGDEWMDSWGQEEVQTESQVFGLQKPS